MLSKTVLFTDMRHICCGDIVWVSEDGNEIPLHKPQEPPITPFVSEIHVPFGIRLAVQKGEKLGQMPNSTRLGNVIYEGGIYRSWIIDVNYPTNLDHGVYSKVQPISVDICSLESNDGWEWKEVARSSLSLPGQTGFDGFTVFVDPSGAENARYKAMYMANPPKEKIQTLWSEYRKIHPRYRDERLNENYITCMYGATSPDGLEWYAISEPLFIHKSDTDTTIYYDSYLEKYVMYTRLFRQDRRWVGRAEADDFKNWGHVEPMLWSTLNDPLSDDIYTNGRTQYPDLSQYHLMFPMYYHRYDQTSDIFLYSSHDGICWNRIPGGPVICHGEQGEWDSEFIYSGKNLVPFGENLVGIPYYGTQHPHKYPRWKSVLEDAKMGWVVWQKNRISSIIADEYGEFYTMPQMPAGRELRINARTGKGGEIKVGIEGQEGRSVDDCNHIIGDSLSHQVHWKGQTDIKAEENKPVIIHFKLRKAEIFGYEWV